MVFRDFYCNMMKKGLSVDFTKHQIHSTNDGNGVSEQVTARDLIETTKMGETRSANLAAVWAFATITDNEDTHFTLRGLDGGVCLTRRNGVTLGEEQEVVNQSLHVLLHGGTRRRGDLVVLDFDGTSGHLVQALVNDAEGLTEFLHTAEVSVVAVTVHTDGDIEIDLVVGIVWLRLADIPWHTGTTQHDTSEAHVESICGADHTDTLCSGLPDTVVSQEFFGFVNAVTELGGPLVNIVEQPEGKVLGNTTRSDVGGVQSSTRDTLVEFLINYN